MKKWITMLLIAGMMFSCSNIAFAETKEEKIKRKAVEEKRAAVKAAKSELNNTVWEITLKEMTSGKNREELSDTLHFTGGKIASDNLVSEGFPASNFTVRIKREDMVIWETMQTGEKGQIAFWRGEVTQEGTVMRGVLSRHIKENLVKDYSFTAVGKTEAIPEPVVEEVVVTDANGEVVEDIVVVSEDVAVVTEAVEEEKKEVTVKKESKRKKRRRWGR